jgi:aminopeptidase-like protein/aminoglycoside N3'-acetyltransferase
MDSHYNRRQLADALKMIGLKSGDVVFSHSNVGFLGVPQEGNTAEAIFQTILGAFQDVLGPSGTLVVPTFTYSFCKGQVFDRENTPSTCGLFTEMMRKHHGSVRSGDPIFSIAAIGARAEELTKDVSEECFGHGSFWDRFFHADGVICNINFDAGSTFIHYVERCLNVPYRYDKLFTGQTIKNGVKSKAAAIYFCQDLSNPDTVAAFEPFDKLARARKLVCSAAVGRGSVLMIRSADVYRLIEESLRENPWLLTASADSPDHAPLITDGTAAFSVKSIGPNASVGDMIEALWMLPRDIVSDGYDFALKALSGIVPMTVHEYPTGTHCWTWIVPEKWTCHEAYIETLEGRRLFSYADNPLHVLSYSLPFDGEVSRAELFEHLYTHPKLPDAIPLRFKYYERDWGLCCSQNLKDSLNDERYRVKINSSFSYGTLKVGEVIAKGRTDKTIVLCAHLCHPAVVNDDLTGVAVGIDIMRSLIKRKDLIYTYRFLIVPETIGSIAYLSHNEKLLPYMKGGLFLEMLGLKNPHALQFSYAGNTEVDQCFEAALKEMDPAGWTGAFRTIIGNDERQFNAPGVRVPMLSLSRVLKPDSPEWPYPEYHSSHDTPALASLEHLQQSSDLVLHMIDTIENNVIPVNKYKGEVFCSRYALHVDFYSDPEGNKALFKIMNLIDGTRSIMQIALACGISFAAARNVVEEFLKHGLVEYVEEVRGTNGN